MAFEGLSSRLQEITRKIRGKARITESDLKEMMREVKLALLEADVNYKIVKDFIREYPGKSLRARRFKIINTRATSYQNCKRRINRTITEEQKAKSTSRQIRQP